MQWEQFQRHGMHDLAYGTATRKVIAIGKPLIAATAAIAGVLAATVLIKKFRR